MKIGIITWFENLNFGTALQAYALQKYLKDNYNCDVSIINYSACKENSLNSFEQKTEHLIYKIYRNIKNRIYDSYKRYDELLDTVYIDEKNKRIDGFNSFLSNISFTEKICSKEDFEALNDYFDFFICGSDQIWNPTILDGHYYLNFVKDKPKISYAASFGIDYLPNYSKPYIADYLKDFKAISLRESTCKSELEKLIKKEVFVVCDPTFLISPDHWRSIASENKSKEKYFVTYFLGDTKLERKAFDTAKKVLKIKNLIIPCTEYAINRSQKENIGFDPKDFISIIHNSEFVLTDSFHAVCFSIMLQKNFCVLKKQSNTNPYKQNSRIESLLAILGLSEHIADNEIQIKEIMKKTIDYKSVNQKLEKYIQDSENYIKECLCND